MKYTKHQLKLLKISSLWKWWRSHPYWKTLPPEIYKYSPAAIDPNTEKKNASKFYYPGKKNASKLYYRFLYKQCIAHCLEHYDELMATEEENIRVTRESRGDGIGQSLGFGPFVTKNKRSKDIHHIIPRFHFDRILRDQSEEAKAIKSKYDLAKLVDHPCNLIQLTRTSHRYAHYTKFKTFGDPGDKQSVRMLKGEYKEVIRESAVKGAYAAIAVQKEKGIGFHNKEVQTELSKRAHAKTDRSKWVEAGKKGNREGKAQGGRNQPLTFQLCWKAQVYGQSP